MPNNLIPNKKSDEKLHLMGEILYLMSASSVHKYFRVVDITNNILPAIELNQYRIYRNSSRPVGFVSWAYFSDELEKKYTNYPTILKLEEWKSGNNLFLIDFIAPFGHAKKIIRDLKDNIFPDRTSAKGLRFKEPGKLHKVSKVCRKNRASNNPDFSQVTNGLLF